MSSKDMSSIGSSSRISAYFFNSDSKSGASFFFFGQSVSMFSISVWANEEYLFFSEDLLCEEGFEDLLCEEDFEDLVPEAFCKERFVGLFSKDCF